ncbi:MAG: hypothetical protein OHK0046_30150 [Anaerolineae bacterium]
MIRIVKNNRQLALVAVYLVIVVLAAGALSNHIWGYWFNPPTASNVTDPFHTVTAGTPFYTNDSLTIIPGNHSNSVFLTAPDTSRAYAHLQPPSSDVPAATLTLVEKYLSTADIKEIEAGMLPRGTIITGENRAGDALLLLTLTLYYPQNDDSYRQYETLFRVDGATLTVLHSQNWRFDWAGIEGFDFRLFAPIISLLLMPVVLLLSRALRDRTPPLAQAA